MERTVRGDPNGTGAEIDYRNLFLAMREAFALHELVLNERGEAVDYRFLDGNPAFFSTLGKSRDEVVGRTVLELFPETESYWIERYAEIVRTEVPASFESFSGALGKWFNVHAFKAETVGPTRGKCFAVLFFDITERKLLENEVSRDESRFKAITNSMQDLIYTLDMEGNISAVYGRWFERYGIDRGTYIGKQAADLIGPGTAAAHRAAFKKALRGEISVHECDFLGLGSDLGPIVQTVFSPMIVEGRVVGIVAVGRDVSDMTRAQRQLKALLEEKLVLLQEVQHRVKNNLQIIISLIQLQVLDNPEGGYGAAFRLFQSRVYAIASVYDVLAASSNTDQVSLAALLRTLSAFCLSLTDTFPNLADIHVQADESISLPVEVAVPVALIVHEALLEWNCRVSSEARPIAIRVSADVIGGNRCRLDVEGPETRSLSEACEPPSILMEGLIDQIKGALETDAEHPGNRCFLFPAAGAGHPIYPL